MICNDMEPGSNQFGDTDRLVLESKLSDMERLSPWVDGIAAKFALDERVRFAIYLCLEEAVSNVILHGYCGEPGRLVTVHCSAYREGEIVITVEDDALPFNPLESTERQAICAHDAGQIGGQGVRLLRGFANTLEYEPKPGGNLLRMGFRTTTPSLSNQGPPN